MDKDYVFCKNCKYFRYRDDNAQELFPLCTKNICPEFTDFVFGGVRYKRCGQVNVDGQCKDFEQKLEPVKVSFWEGIKRKLGFK